MIPIYYNLIYNNYYYECHRDNIMTWCIINTFPLSKTRSIQFYSHVCTLCCGCGVDISLSCSIARRGYALKSPHVGTGRSCAKKSPKCKNTYFNNVQFVFLHCHEYLFKTGLNVNTIIIIIKYDRCSTSLFLCRFSVHVCAFVNQ